MQDLEPGWRNSSLDRLAIDWLDWLLNVKGRSKTTINTYGVYLKLYFNWCAEHGVRPLYPTLSDLEAFLVRPRLRQGHGNTGAPSTQRGNVTVLRGWFKWMLQRGHVTTDPTAELEGPKVNRKLPKPIPDNHWLTLWNEGQLHGRYRLALGLGYYCGLRRQEMCELVGRQITKTHIKPFVRKGGGEDSLPWRGMVDTISDLRPELLPEPELFIDLMESAPATYGREKRVLWVDGQQFYKLMVKQCDRLSLPHYTPHQLRHSCATNLVRLGMPELMVAELLNHTSVDTTRQYVQLNGADLDKWRRSVVLRNDSPLRSEANEHGE